MSGQFTLLKKGMTTNLCHAATISTKKNPPSRCVCSLKPSKSTPPHPPFEKKHPVLEEKKQKRSFNLGYVVQSMRYFSRWGRIFIPRKKSCRMMITSNLVKTLCKKKTPRNTSILVMIHLNKHLRPGIFNGKSMQKSS